jgi:hypothetical protein
MDIEEVKMLLSDIESWILVLVIISKRSRGGRPTVEATISRIQRDLKDIYGRNLTEREIEYILQDLQNRNFVSKKKGLLRDGRAVLYALNPCKITQEAFNVIKINPKRAYVHNGYEGMVYDPPSIEADLPETNNTEILLEAGGIILELISIPLLNWATLNRDWIAQQMQEGWDNFCRGWNDFWGQSA